MGIMARFRGPRVAAAPVVPAPVTEVPIAAAGGWVALADIAPTPSRRRYGDALNEARDQCIRLGLDADEMSASAEVADHIRFAYAQGWIACESRLAAPNMADAIDLALTTPAAVVEQLAGESLHRWTIRAVQNVVAHGATSERKTAV